jgi:hypothetical protein
MNIIFILIYIILLDEGISDTFLLNYQLMGYETEQLIRDMILRYEIGESPLISFIEKYNIDEEDKLQIKNFCGVKKKVLALIDKWISKYPDDILNHPKAFRLVKTLSSFLSSHPVIYFPSLSDSIRSTLDLFVCFFLLYLIFIFIFIFIFITMQIIHYRKL